MVKRRKLRNTRQKALFGEAITAAATLAAAGIQAAATAKSARTQADSILQNAKDNAEAMQLQNDNNNKLQTELLEFTKTQNDQNRQIMKDMQMNLQLAAGAQSARDRREASKIIVKYGGKKRRKLRDIAYSFLQGGNIPFQVTDGGGVIPIGQTPEGFDIYKIFGDSHKDYHRTRGGKYKSGVGFKYPDGSEIEGERNELAVATPDDMYFLSAHTRHGFNPAKAVENGMNPIYAYQIQEAYKNVDGIDSEGNYTPPVERRLALAGGSTRNNKTTKQTIRSLNNRHKFEGGGWWIGPTIGAAGNFLGAGLASWGIGSGSKYLSRRVGEAGDILANAYGQLRGVNFDDVFGGGANGKLSFSLGHYMPAVRSSYYNADPWLEEVHRNLRRVQGATNNTTGSTAAQLNRLNTATANAAEETSKIYANKANIEEQYKQANMQAINEAAAHNAQLDIEMNKNYMATRADLAKFNANIENEKILGAAEARSDALTQQGAIGAQSRQGIGNAWGSALAQSGLGFANAYNSKLAQDNNLRLARLSATPTGELAYLSDPNTPIAEAQSKISQWRAAANAASDQGAKDYFNGLADQLEAARFNKKSNKPNWLGKVNDIIDSLNNIRYLNYKF